MPSRYTYRPAEFVQASTPAYDNLVGIVKDQKKRIQRNQQLMRQSEQRLAEMSFEAAMNRRSRQFKSEEAEEQREFEAEQAERQRNFQSSKFWISQQAQMQRHKDMMAYRFMNSRMQAIEKLREQNMDEISDIEEMFNKEVSKLADAGINISGFNMMGANRFVKDPDGDFRMVMPDRENERSWPTRDEAMDVVQRTKQYHENLFEGKNKNEFLRSTKSAFTSGYDKFNNPDTETDEDSIQSYTLKQDGVTWYSREALANLWEQYERQPNNENLRAKLNELSKPGGNAQIWLDEDQGPQGYDIENVRQHLGQMENSLMKIGEYAGLPGITETGTGGETEPINKFIMNPAPIEGGGLGKRIEGKSLFEVEQSWREIQRTQQKASSSEKPLVESQFNSLKKGVESYRKAAFLYAKQQVENDNLPSELQGYENPYVLSQFVTVSNRDGLIKGADLEETFNFNTKNLSKEQVDKLVKGINKGVDEETAAQMREQEYQYDLEMHQKYGRPMSDELQDIYLQSL